MAHVWDRWTEPDGVDRRGRPKRKDRPKEDQTGKQYVAVWHEGGRRRAKSFDNKEAAERHIVDVTRAQELGTHIETHKKTVSEYGLEWLESQLDHRPSTRKVMLQRWARIEPAIGHMQLREVTRPHIQRLVNDWSNGTRDHSGYAPATVRANYVVVASMFKSAVLDKLIAATPCERIKLPKKPSGRITPMTTEQVFAVADTIAPHLRGMVLFGAGSGMRQAEMTGLTVDRVTFHDDGTATVRVDRQLIQAHPPTWAEPKTDRSDRSIGLDEFTTAALREHMAAYPPNELGMIFMGARGGGLDSSRASDRWRDAVATLPMTQRTSWHSLRHYHASALIAAGMSPTAVADRLGHQNSSVTLSVYSHLWPSDESRARAAIAAQLWGR